MKTLLEIGDVENVEPYVKKALGGEAKDDGLWPRRLQNGRPARHAPAQVFQRDGRNGRRLEVV